MPVVRVPGSPTAPRIADVRERVVPDGDKGGEAPLDAWGGGAGAGAAVAGAAVGAGDGPNGTPLSVLRASKADALLPPVLMKNVVVRSRADLRQLAGVRSIDGDLTLCAPDIDEADLAALSPPLERVSGDLMVHGLSVAALPLAGLTRVDGSVRIEECPKLARLDGLGVARAGFVVIGDLPALTTLRGLRLRDAAGLQLNRLPVTGLAGLEGITQLDMFLSLHDNRALTDLSALSSLRAVGDVFIEGSPGLTDLSPLSRLALRRGADPFVRGTGVDAADVAAAFARWRGNAAAPPPLPPALLGSVPRAPWTFFVYLNADNNLDGAGKADLAEMARVGSLPGQMNVLALVDGRADKSRLVFVEKGSLKTLDVDPASSLGRLLAAGDGELDMGDPRVLRAAVQYVQQAFPSEHFLLDVWDHGRAWDMAGIDDTSGTLLRVARGDLTTALEGLSLDIIAFDACLMASAEVASVGERLGASWLVGSEEVEPSTGWPYAALLERLAALARDGGALEAGDVARSIVDTYAGGGARNITMSATRLDALAAVRTGVEDLARAVVDAGGFSGNPALRSIYLETLRFGGTLQMDLGDFADRIAGAFPDGPLRAAAFALLHALAASSYAATSARVGRTTNARGLSAYAPLSPLENGYPSTELPGWQDMLRTYLAPPPGAPPPPWAEPRRDFTPAPPPWPATPSTAPLASASRPPSRAATGVVVEDWPGGPWDWRRSLRGMLDVDRGALHIRGTVPDRPWHIAHSVTVDAAARVVTVHLDTWCTEAERAAGRELPAVVDVTVPLPPLAGGFTVEVVERGFATPVARWNVA